MDTNSRRVKPKRIQAVDFFCGAGGVTCGFSQAGIEVLGGLDIDSTVQKTYEQNHNVIFHHADVSNLKIDSLKKLFGIKRNQRNLLFIGCSPCQYYSKIMTDKTRSEHTRLLLSDFQEFVAYYRPGYVFIENVPGIEKRKGSPLENFKSFLSDNGYCFDDKVVNAKYYGVPQNRIRYVLLASRIMRHIELPKPDKNKVKTVREAIGDTQIFRPLNAGETDTSQFIHSTAELSSLNLQRIKATPHNGGDRRAWKNNPNLQLKCYTKHEGHYDVYGRMHWDRPSPAITTRFRSLSNGRYGHPEQDRAISLREGATLQTFPLDYEFYSGSRDGIAKMIGNAVPPELARRIALSIINSTGG